MAMFFLCAPWEGVRLVSANSGSEAQVDQLNQPQSSGTAQFNLRNLGLDSTLVLLNGRQMPGASLNGFSASNSRSFDFANLASEAVAGVEVYKTGRAAIPSGGIGATFGPDMSMWSVSDSAVAATQPSTWKSS